MYLIIQIPAFNEEKHISDAIEKLPKSLPGIEKLEIIVVDDGSSDRTSECAHSHGARVISADGRHRGLAQAFYLGVNYARQVKADYLVNFDADLQYSPDEILGLLWSSQLHSADMVIGARPVMSLQHFSIVKKVLQKIGSLWISVLCGLWVPDATSGFRLLNRRALLELEIFSDFTYTLESVLDLKWKGLKIVSTPVSAQAPVRESRLFKTNYFYIWKSILTVFTKLFQKPKDTLNEKNRRLAHHI